MPSLLRPGDKPLVHVGLLVLTLASTFGTFFLTFGGSGAPDERIMGAASFSLALVLILGSHEMGHYIYARIHQVDTTLPYFIPAPLLGLGTLGAVIRIKSRIPHRNALVDIGAAGPLAGLLVAIPILCIGLAHSTVVDAPFESVSQFPGRSSLWVLFPQFLDWVMAKVSGHTVLPTEADPRAVALSFGDNILLMVLQHWVLGPVPPGKEVLSHPLVIAGWFGLLVTMLNLIPIGQLDGGHLAHAVLGRRAEWVGRVMGGVMVFLCVFYTAGWLVWLIVTTRFVGFRHPEVLEPAEPLSNSRRLVCAACLLAFFMCFMPVPIQQVYLR